MGKDPPKILKICNYTFIWDVKKSIFEKPTQTKMTASVVLVDSMLASGTQVRGFKPGRSRWIFTDIKILIMPSSGGELKEYIPCPSFAACKKP
jgi:hypothetical protein